MRRSYVLTVDGHKKIPGCSATRVKPIMVLPVTPPGLLSFKTREREGGMGCAPSPLPPGCPPGGHQKWAIKT